MSFLALEESSSKIKSNAPWIWFSMANACVLHRQICRQAVLTLWYALRQLQEFSQLFLYLLPEFLHIREVFSVVYQGTQPDNTVTR